MLFKFANPDILLLLFIVPAFIIGFIVTRILRTKNIKKFGESNLMKDLMPGASSGKEITKFCLMMLALVALIICVARPQFGSKLQNVKKKGVEVMVALDISNSMLAEDIKPNRLERSKNMLYQILDGLDNDKIGVVVFAGTAFTQLPITTDYQSSRMFISSITPKLIDMQGTAIGGAIEKACTAFSEETENGKAIIIITDGENHEDDAEAAAKKAAEKGIQVNVVGIGSINGAPVPIEGTNDYIRDQSGNYISSALNETMCMKIAQAGNGIYVRADNSNNALKVIQEEINKISKHEVDVKVYSEYEEQYPTFAWIALIILVAEIFIMEKKNKLFRNFKLFNK
ncbi:MAG: VWA domain-containing protein [Paludibacteraceae bacterium]|nr:VWA domain-containing protein [Paludibacteraceae bacterium]MBP5482050.1 VWA domain-containing protein [Paludibacteraceae bacterium]